MTDATRMAFITKLGRLPEACPLEARVEERVAQDGYTRERVTFQANPGVRVPAYLLIPDGLTDSAPAILGIHQHNGEYQWGKSEVVGPAGNLELAYGLDLCRRGYVVLAPDLLCFEERQAKEPMPQGGGYEKLIAMRCLLDGSSLQARYVWDLARAVDYLVTRPEVNASKIGTIGHSLGGQEVCWALMFDRRLQAGVCSCGVGTFETIFRDGINHNFAAYVPGLREVGDMDALVAAIAPTPLLITAGISDPIFPIDGVRQIGQTAVTAYANLNVAEAFRLNAFAGGHGFPPEIRQEAYDWLDQWLH